MTKQAMIDYLRSKEKDLSGEVDKAYKFYGVEDGFTQRMLSKWALMKEILEDLDIDSL